MKRHFLVLKLFLSSLALLVLWTCSDSSTNPKEDNTDDNVTGEGTVVLAEITNILNESDLSSLTSYSGAEGTFYFSSANEKIMSLNRNDIIVSGVVDAAEEGFFRKISSISQSENEITVFTEQANFEDAIESGHMSFKQTLKSNQIESTKIEPGISLEKAADSDYTIVNIPNYQIADGITVNGNVGYNIAFEFNIDVDDFQLKELSFIVTSGFFSELNFETTVNSEVYDKINIATILYTPITIMIGELPVVISPELSIYVGIDGEVSMGIKTGIEQEIDCEGGLQYNGSWSPVNNFTSNFEFSSPELNDACHLIGYLGPEFALKLYGIVGPYAYLRGYIELDANMVDDVPWWGLYGGFRNGLGVKLEVLGNTIADYEPDPIIDYRKTLMTGHGDVNHNWDLQNLESIPASGKFSIDLDQTDTPFICYQATRGSDQVLRLAHSVNGFWELETVDMMWHRSACWPKLVVNNDNIHISYMGETQSGSPQFKYAHYNDNTWQIDTLDFYNAYNNIQLIVDDNGEIHIFANNVDQHELTYFNKSETGWSGQVLLSDVGYYEGSSSAALSTQKVPYLFYFDFLNSGEWKLGHFDNDTWIEEVVPNETSRLLAHASLTFDQNNSPMIAYNTYYYPNLFLVSNKGSGWNTDTVDATYIEYVTLNVDADNIEHMSYYDTGDILKYARWLGDGWGIEKVDRTSDVGRCSDSELDSQGNPHIVYYDYTNKIIKYAKYTGN